VGPLALLPETCFLRRRRPISLAGCAGLRQRTSLSGGLFGKSSEAGLGAERLGIRIRLRHSWGPADSLGLHAFVLATAPAVDYSKRQ
jgi:hypothetical protein